MILLLPMAMSADPFELAQEGWACGYYGYWYSCTNPHGEYLGRDAIVTLWFCEGAAAVSRDVPVCAIVRRFEGFVEDEVLAVAAEWWGASGTRRYDSTEYRDHTLQEGRHRKKDVRLITASPVLADYDRNHQTDTPFSAELWVSRDDWLSRGYPHVSPPSDPSAKVAVLYNERTRKHAELSPGMTALLEAYDEALRAERRRKVEVTSYVWAMTTQGYTLTDDEIDALGHYVYYGVWPEPSLPTAVCNDGWISYSEHNEGTCAQHGGVHTWVE